MPKLILSIKTRNKSFNLLEKVYKDFGVVFNPKTPVTEVKTLVGELKWKKKMKLQAKYDKTIVREQDLLEKLKKRSKKRTWLGRCKNKVSSSHPIKREENSYMKKILLMTILVRFFKFVQNLTQSLTQKASLSLKHLMQVKYLTIKFCVKTCKKQYDIVILIFGYCSKSRDSIYRYL